MAEEHKAGRDGLIPIKLTKKQFEIIGHLIEEKRGQLAKRRVDIYSERPVFHSLVRLFLGID